MRSGAHILYVLFQIKSAIAVVNAFTIELARADDQPLLLMSYGYGDTRPSCRARRLTLPSTPHSTARAQGLTTLIHSTPMMIEITTMMMSYNLSKVLTMLADGVIIRQSRDIIRWPGVGFRSNIISVKTLPEESKGPGENRETCTEEDGTSA